MEQETHYFTIRHSSEQILTVSDLLKLSKDFLSLSCGLWYLIKEDTANEKKIYVKDETGKRVFISTEIGEPTYQIGMALTDEAEDQWDQAQKIEVATQPNFNLVKSLFGQ